MFKRVENQDLIEQKLNDGSVKRYVKGRLLGKGGFAKCYEFTSLQTQKKYAAKIIDKATLDKAKARQKLTSQIKIHKSLRHPYIVRFEHFFEDAEYVYILLEKCPNQTLNELIKRRKRLTDIQAKYYIRQLVSALQYVHDERVIHRDLKLGNLFLSDKLQIKIGDFGLATKLAYHGERKKTKCGTPNYIAPEILDDKKSHSYEVDIWSLGVIAYTMLIGRPPFETNDVKLTYNRIKTCSYTFPDSVTISQNARSFISKLLQLDPSKRPTLEEILADPFLLTESIPEGLPIASLACPPSLDFLKKYRMAEEEEIKSARKIESMKGSTLYFTVGEQKKSNNASNFLSREKSLKNLKNPTNRLHSNEKAEKKPVARISSTINLGTLKNPLTKKGKKNTNSLGNKAAKVWVTYFQENHKFGLGYLLNSNASGFRYNDSTIMITNCKNSTLKYIDYNPNSRKLVESGAKILRPEDAEVQEFKKYKIMVHFEKQLRKKKDECESKMSNQARIKIQSLKYRQNAETEMGFYVVRYHRTNKSTVFWLNNNAVQIIFEDGSQLLLSDSGVITYVNKCGDRTYFQEKDKDKQSQEVKKRLLHFYSVIKGRIWKKQAPEQNQKHSERSEGKKMHQNKPGLTRCSSTRNCIKNGQGKPATKLKNCHSSSRLDPLKKSVQNR